jgi:hypothetical protein
MLHGAKGTDGIDHCSYYSQALRSSDDPGDTNHPLEGTGTGRAGHPEAQWVRSEGSASEMSNQRPHQLPPIRLVPLLSEVERLLLLRAAARLRVSSSSDGWRRPSCRWDLLDERRRNSVDLAGAAEG